VDETAKRFKALERTREAGTAQSYGSVVPGLILGDGTQSLTLTPNNNPAGLVIELKLMLVSQTWSKGFVLLPGHGCSGEV